MAEMVEKGMNDTRLRPRLLQSLLRDKLIPNEYQPVPSPIEISALLDRIRVYGLLSEHVGIGGGDWKVEKEWKEAVDSWVDRVVLLIDSNVPDKSWMGVSLLGMTCVQCSSERFLASYSLWFQKLFGNLQQSSSSHFVKVACCASLSDLLSRLSNFPSEKKDATSLTGKVIQPLLALLKDDHFDSLLEGILDLLYVLMTTFPISINRHYDNVESVLVSTIMSGKCSENISKKLARSLALLPKGRGDGDSWSIMILKILFSINTLLTDAFQGLEDESKKSEVMKLLVPPGKDPPAPLGGNLMSEQEHEQTVKTNHDLLVPRVSTLVKSCSLMLSYHFPGQVAVPIKLMASLTERVLLLDGSLHKGMQQFTTSLHQELVCSELPALHASFLDLLMAIIKGMRSQLLPHAAKIARLLTDYFREARLPSLRVKVYSIIQTLLISMGVGMALYFAQDLVDNAFADLEDHSHTVSVPSSVYSFIVAGSTLPSSNRKRKHASGSFKDQLNGVDNHFEAAKRRPVVPFSVKIVVLRALQALLAVGGSLKSEQWRPKVDRLLITVATNACDAGWDWDYSNDPLRDDTCLSDFQLASLEALLASFLSYSPVRPPYLSQGLELFHRAKQESGTKIASFCTQALLALEVLIHPRALPLVDLPASRGSMFDETLDNRHRETSIFVGQKPNMQAFYQNVDDEEYFHNWLSNDEETNADGGKIEYDIDKPQESPSPSELPEPVVGSQDLPCAVDGEMIDQHRTVDVEMACGDQKKDIDNSRATKELITSDTTHGSPVQCETGQRIQLKISDRNLDLNEAAEIPASQVSIGATESMNAVESPDAANPDKDTDVGAYKDLSITNKEKGIFTYSSDLESMDSLPDIVDGDPDSD